MVGLDTALQWATRSALWWVKREEFHVCLRKEGSSPSLARVGDTMSARRGYREGKLLTADEQQ